LPQYAYLASTFDRRTVDPPKLEPIGSQKRRHARVDHHLNVGAGVTSGERERALPVTGLEDDVVLELEDLADQIADLGLVVDHENGLGSGRPPGRAGGRDRLVDPGQVDLEGRAAPRVAQHANLPAELR